MVGFGNHPPLMTHRRPPSPAPRACAEPLDPLVGMLDEPEGPVQTRHPRTNRTGSGQVRCERRKRKNIRRCAPVPVGVGPGEVGKGHAFG
eukprot:932865-Alexandrium_andersonii.AAC.1